MLGRVYGAFESLFILAMAAGALVAGLFALHPLHVESVAWVSERKDVLSTLFGLLTIAAYVRYTERPGGYTRILKLGPRRSDSTEMVLLELV